MVRKVRTPSFAADYFSPGELSGWAHDLYGIQWTPKQVKAKKRRAVVESVKPPTVAVHIGKRAPVANL